MIYRLFLQTSALQDLRDAYQWYESQKTGLGDEFLTAVDEIFDLMEQNPLLFALAYRQMRRAVLRGFPFNIIFTVEGDLIRVSAVIHGKRDPKKWQE